jgi:hypothetical protein
MKSHFFVAALLVAGLCGGQPTAALTLPSHRHSVNISGDEGGPVSDCSGLHIRFDNRAAVACSLNPTEIRPSVVTPVFATTRAKRGMKTIAASSWQSSRRHSSVHGERSCVRQANY